MPLKDVVARPHPGGNRIDISWTNPDPSLFSGVRVMRKPFTHPVHPHDGFLVAEGIGLVAVSDTGLSGETVYYYSLFPFQGNPPVYDLDARNRTRSLSTSPHGLARHMYDSLPRIYHRYDTKLPDPAAVAPQDLDKGQLLRFLELPGGQLDMLLSQARALLGSHDGDRVDGGLLPLLAQWIGWNTDYRLELSSQRAELRNAPFLYRTIGIIATVEATVKRIAGWRSRTKEFVHNVFAATSPMRLNLWSTVFAKGAWQPASAPLSLDYLHEGRAAAAREADGTLWLFYHTERNGRWNIWYKTLENAVGAEWSPSVPLLARQGVDRHPAAAVQAGRLWVFWDGYASGTWRLEFRYRETGAWSAPAPFRADNAERRWPCLSDSGASGLWLAWAEKTASRWKLRYNVFLAGAWQAADIAFPDAAGADPRIEEPPFVLSRPAAGELWIFWARREYNAAGAGQTRWRVCWRVKHNLNPDTTGWDPAVSTLDVLAGPDYHDRDPSAYLDGAGQVRLLWSSSRGGSWSVWTRNLSVTDSPERITPGPYAARHPLPVAPADGPTVLYRSNAPIRYPSEAYTATLSQDLRYSGSSSADCRDAGKIALHGKYDDFATYTYDAGSPSGRDDGDWYSRDTLGLYLTTDTLDPDSLKARYQRLAGVLREFMPATDRAVLIDESAEITEAAYAYDPGAGGSGGFITETWRDQLNSVVLEAPLAGGEDFADEWT